ncbi:LLM class flavin-dependent oxidoreductase [Paucisalibacillus sp. EB02]|uniref:LLM class flavin-dependent oxidoreductase n=1 Tax=Paucisalibacillus sp. EB02 TaxID=1347087 RepID=UPI0004B524F2|nr:LLM class flavin-dependent oxidoreductase [Paucisalibacillus sp. EB02]
MKLSILDQVPIALGQTAQDALFETLNLAKLGDELGYHRYWVAEHHNLKGLACPAPEVLLGIIGGQTKKIRIGAGAILLPHYKPFKVAETFNLLATMYPNRVDLGLGRSPGGSAEASVALSGNFLENVRKMPELIDELLRFFNGDFKAEHMFSNLKPAPVPNVLPVPWLLGTSEKSAVLAAEKGLHYAFGHFMSEVDAKPIISKYRYSLKEKYPNKTPEIIMAIQVICAETSGEAEKLALESFKWSRIRGEYSNSPNNIEDTLSKEEQDEYDIAKQKMIVGNPQEVKEKLNELQQKYQVDDFMILTNTPTYSVRKKSYQLLAEEVMKLA